MFGFLKRWRPSTLLASWVVYWVVLAFVALGPAFAALWKATHAGSGKADFSLNFGNGLFTLVVNANGKMLYTGSASVLAIALLVGVPPLLVWALWVAQRPRGERRPEDLREHV
jgi:hypothetical protein